MDPERAKLVWVDPATATIVSVEDPASGDAASAVTEKYYPVHAAKVGGILWRLAMTFAGISLAMLGILATWSFWMKPMVTPNKMRKRGP